MESLLYSQFGNLKYAKSMPGSQLIHIQSEAAKRTPNLTSVKPAVDASAVSDIFICSEFILQKPTLLCHPISLPTPQQCLRAAECVPTSVVYPAKPPSKRQERFYSLILSCWNTASPFIILWSWYNLFMDKTLDFKKHAFYFYTHTLSF